MKVLVDFEPFYYNGNMLFFIYVNDALAYHWHSKDPSSVQHAEFMVDGLKVDDRFHIRFCVEGKDQLHDTEISHGKITADKAIEIISVSIDGIDVTHNLFLYKFITQSGMTILKTKYFGFDGYMDIDISPNIIEWMKDCKNKLSLQGPSFEEFLKEVMS